jgi:hypothetical protein
MKMHAAGQATQYVAERINLALQIPQIQTRCAGQRPSADLILSCDLKLPVHILVCYLLTIYI